MEPRESQIQTIPVQLDNGTVIRVQVTSTGREDVAFDIKSFNQVTEALEGICQTIAETLHKVKPDKASVKFGMELAIESGHLTAVIAKGTSKANLEFILEWKKEAE